MINVIVCPNCDALMEIGGTCPDCNYPDPSCNLEDIDAEDRQATPEPEDHTVEDPDFQV